MANTRPSKLTRNRAQVWLWVGAGVALFFAAWNAVRRLIEVVDVLDHGPAFESRDAPLWGKLSATEEGPLAWLILDIGPGADLNPYPSLQALAALACFVVGVALAIGALVSRRSAR